MSNLELNTTNEKTSSSMNDCTTHSKGKPQTTVTPNPEELSELGFFPDIESIDKHFMINILTDHQFNLCLKDPNIDSHFQKADFFSRFLAKAEKVFETNSERKEFERRFKNFFCQDTTFCIIFMTVLRHPDFSLLIKTLQRKK
jgi:hypothetical protein